MVFKTTTTPPETTAAQERQEHIKGLLFEAVRLYVEDNEPARKELLALLNQDKSED